MGFPNKDEINRALKKLENVEGSLALNDDASTLEKFRFDICQKFLKFKREQGLTQREIAERVNIDEATISKIFRHRIDKISTDYLIDLYLQLDSNLDLKVS
ncbi:MAG: XRE family transcriptional regulator [Bacteriovoracaceae bacterium]